MAKGITPVRLAFILGLDNDPGLARNILLDLLEDGKAPHVVCDAYDRLKGYAMDTKIPESILGQVITLIRGNDMVRAVKLVRAEMGLGLKEALDACKEVQAQLPPQ